MTETQQRFLRAIAERVPVEQVVELHLFPPIRQGGVETGVAVVAEDPRRPVPNADPSAPDGASAVTESVSAAAEAVADAVEPVSSGDQSQENAPETSETQGPAAAIADEDLAVAHATDLVEVSAETADGEEVVAEADDESPYADEVYDDTDESDGVDAEEADDTADAETTADVVAESNGHARPAPVSRYTIHTARYRLTLKGVDRGKWEVDVVAEADAPLEAVDAVVRGVQRRAGEGTEPDRLNAEAFRGALEAPLATLER